MIQKGFIIVLILVCTATLYSQTAPDFSFTTLENEKQNLSDLKGEVLYVSFWASWCEPCFENFVKYENMRNKLSDLGVVLLNVNIDKEETNWHNAMAKHHINGIHVRGIGLDDLQEVYNLYSIPSYEIINKKGEFVYLSDRPNRNIIEEFKQWVKK